MGSNVHFDTEPEVRRLFFFFKYFYGYFLFMTAVIIFFHLW